MKLPASSIFRLLGVLALTASLATPAAAVPVALTDGSGNLTGATGVVVGAVTYNVSFVEGSCNSLFGGCNPANFDFHTTADALAASQALLDQIISDFGNHPDKIFGCGAVDCSIVTPGTTILTPSTGLVMQGESVLMAPLFSFLGTSSFTLPAAVNTSGDNFTVFADWTEATPTVGNNVPEPGSLALLGLGMAALGWSRRRHAAVKAAL